jgi:delta24-sterol reductase
MGAYILDHHDLAVKELANTVAQFYASNTPFRINHGSTNSTRRRDPATPQLHIAHLNHILDIDVATETALVEPNVSLDSLVRKTLAKGLMPPVVMEFPGITVGGGFSGASGESTDWREGLFDCTVKEVEMILGNGEVLRAEKDGQNADLFDGARCTLGTLGVITLLKVRLVRVQDAVQLIYHHTSSVSETIGRLSSFCNDDHANFDFIEGLQFSQVEGVILTGKHVSLAAPNIERMPRQRFDRAIDPWFYMHAKGTPEAYTEVIPTQSYLFRHDRGAFWSGDVFLKYYGLPNTGLIRWLLNPLMTARAIYKAMLATNSADGAIVQDFLLPLDTSEAFVQYTDKELGIWPLWICPIRKTDDDAKVLGWPFYKSKDAKAPANTWISTQTEGSRLRGELMLNFGVWGPTDPTPTVVRKTNRDLEQKLRELRGMKVPYAANFYTEDEFWDLYDRQKYDKLRAAWHAGALPSMYDKVCRKQSQSAGDDGDVEHAQGKTWLEAVLQTWPLGGLYQTFHVFFR